MLDKKQLIFFFTIFLMATLLRVIWVADMDWKIDESHMFELSKNVGNGIFLPVGMSSGVGVPNPGLSVWFFGLIRCVVDTPINMVRFVQFINIAAIWLAVLFIFTAESKIPREERWIWLGGIALAAVSPLPLLYSRKIWAQSAFPFFTYMVFFFNLYRHRPTSAFLWGLTGALVGQLHMAGFFMAGGMFSWTVYKDFRLGRLRAVNWYAWFVGSFIGALALIPWMIKVWEYLQTSSASGGNGPISFKQIIKLHFYWCYFLDALGLFVKGAMGKHFYQFVKVPEIFGFSTYFVLFLHICLATIGIFALYIGGKKVVAFFKKYKMVDIIKLKFSDKKWGESTIIHLTCATGLGMGILITIAGVKFHISYLHAIFPMQFVLVAFVLKNHPKILKTLIGLTLVLSVGILIHIHYNNHVIGKTYNQHMEGS